MATSTFKVAQGGTGAQSTSQNFAFIGPTSGSGAPGFRALTAGDVPTTNLGGLAQISQIVTAASQATVDFTSIPSGYTDLIVTFQARSNVAAVTEEMSLKVNNDGTSGNYSISQVLYGNNATAAATTNSASSAGMDLASIAGASAVANHASVGTVKVNAYTATTFFKAIICDANWVQNAGAALIGLTIKCAVWLNTAAITRLTFSVPTSFVNGSTFTLYGTLPPAATSAFTQGSVIFAGASVYAQDNANFFYDATNHRLGVDNAGPLSALHIGSDTTAYGDSNVARITANNAEVLGLVGSASTTNLNFYANAVTGRIAVVNVLKVGTNGGKINLYTKPDGSGIAIAMTLDSTGMVGIGTTSPTSPLQVVTLPTYATNAAALAGGLTAGAFFKVNVAGEYFVHVVV